MPEQFAKLCKCRNYKVIIATMISLVTLLPPFAQSVPIFFKQERMNLF